MITLNTTNWKHYYSISPDRLGVAYTGAIYEPLLNDSETILCMNFNNSSYRTTEASEELLNACFAREVKFLTYFQKYDWCARLIDVDYATRRIFVEWRGDCCEKILRRGDDVADFCPTWQQDLETIIRDIRTEQIYKITMYPCYHYVKEGKLKAFGFYTTCSYAEQPIAIDLYRPILNAERSKYIDQIAVDGKVDFAILNEYSLTKYVKWPGDPLPEIYQRVYHSDNCPQHL